MKNGPLNPAVAELVAGQLKIAAHPVRLRILQLLRAEEQGLNVGRIADRLGLAQPIASQHLITMRDRGLLTSKKIETLVIYSLGKETRPLVETLLAHTDKL